MDVGAELKQARIARAWYIPEIAHKLQVPATAIRAVEHNDFGSAGGAVAAGEIVKAYALAVGLDPAPLLAAMTADAPYAGVGESRRTVRGPGHGVVWAANSRRWTAVAGASVIVAAGLWLALSGSAPEGPSASPSASVAATDTTTATPSASPTQSAVETPTQAAVETPTATPSATPSRTKPAAELPHIYRSTHVDGLIVLAVECFKTSYVSIYNAHGRLFQGWLQPGDAREFTSDTDVTITSTNAGGFTLSVSGTRYGVPGAVGQSYSHTFLVD
jgi:cytoskeletal protein RodZ